MASVLRTWSGFTSLTTIDSLLVVSHVRHYAWKGQLYAYAPYAREIEIWADLFPRLVIAAPCRNERPPGDTIAFTRHNIDIERQIEPGGHAGPARLRRVLLVPVLAWSLTRAMRRAAAVHVRCPGSLGLIGACLAPAFCRYRVAKYAGQWSDYPGQAFTARLQKDILRSRWWHAPVTVYGHWPGEPSHVVPFFTSVLTREQMNRAQRAALARRVGGSPLHMLYVGQLGWWKNVDQVIRAVRTLSDQGVPVECDIVGEGPARAELESLVKSLGLGKEVRFAGGVELEQVFPYYEHADVLVLVSNSEGWPKAITEAMAFGLICVGSDRGLVPQILGDGRGFIVPPEDDAALTETLLRIARSPDRLPAMRARAAEWGQRYTLEDLRAALAQLLTTFWGITIPDPSAKGSPATSCT